MRISEALRHVAVVLAARLHQNSGFRVWVASPVQCVHLEFGSKTIRNLVSALLGQKCRKGIRLTPIIRLVVHEGALLSMRKL